MSRFNNWTIKDVLRLEASEATLTKPKKLSLKTPQVDKICEALRILGIDHVTEYRFLHDRRFRFDIAIPDKKIAIEFEGGIYSKGRHTRGKGYAGDAKKYNLATMHGWKLLRYTSDDTKEINWEFKIAEEISQLIKTLE